jgi:choline dehydrogenase-like flavoprotein
MARLVLEDQADFVIIGTGAGGATAARVLAAAGHDVLLLEEGPHLRTEDRPRDLLRAMGAAVRHFGTQSTLGSSPIPLVQGRLVGGSTAINSGIIWRMPEDVRRNWIEEHGLSWLVEDGELDRIFSVIEDELEIVETGAAVLGRNSEKMAEACEALGLPGKAITRNARRCQGRARCLQGCPSEARQSMDVSYIPRAMADGARLHAMCRADRVKQENGRAALVVGEVREQGTERVLGRFEVRARRGVIVACGAVHTPVLLRRSGIRGASGLVGERFQMHPGCAVVGRFDEPVHMGFGATQGYEVPMREQGFKLESLGLPPEMLAARLPGAGAEWQERLSSLDCFAQWAVQIRMQAHGSVKPSFRGQPIPRFVPTPRDVERGQKAIALLARMFFAAGATEVELIEHAKLTRADFHFVASHLFGTACAGADPKRSVVGEALEVHGVPGLYVMDASVFPTNMGVNPQHSIMAVVWRASERLANEARTRAAA